MDAEPCDEWLVARETTSPLFLLGLRRDNVSLNE